MKQIVKLACGCQGRGWIKESPDRWVECPTHHVGQLHPDTEALLLDEPNRLEEEKRKSAIRWLIRESKNKINQLQEHLRTEQAKLVQLELELINRTPTVRAIQVVVPIEPEPLELKEEDFI